MDGYFDFKDLIIRILKKWRLIFVCMLLFGILLGGVKGMTTVPHIGETITETGDEQLKEDIDNMEESLEILDRGIGNWDAYYANSKLMHLDSYNVTVYSLTFSVITDDALNFSDAATIAASCKSIIESGAFNQEIAEETGIAENDIKDLILVTTDQGTVKIRGYEYEGVEIDQAVDALYAKLTDRIRSMYGDKYSVEYVYSGFYTCRDNTLSTLQDTTIANGERYISEKSSRGRVIEELRAKAPSETITAQSAVTDIVMFGVAGCLGGALFAVLLGLFMDLMSKRLYSEREIQKEFNLRCFAGENILPKKKNVIDRLIDNMYSTKHELTDEEWVDYVISRIGRENISENRILLTGSILNGSVLSDCEKLNKMTEKNDAGTVALCLGKSVISDAETMREIEDFQSVIIVERIGQSELPLIREEIDIIKGLNKRVLGFILV